MKTTLLWIGLNVALLAQVRYDAASIKPSKPGGGSRPRMEFLPGGRFRSTNMPLLPVLATAYSVPFATIDTLRVRMKGVPDWLGSEPYDIEATAESGSTGAPAKLRNERIQGMLQAVFKDRLKLIINRDVLEMPIYALVAGPHGPRLTAAKIQDLNCTESAPFGGTGCHQFQGGAGRGLKALAVDMPDLALYLSGWSERPIVDQTKVKGLYEIQTEGWSEGWALPGSDPNRKTLEEVLDSLGLKLVRQKGPVVVYVIEHIERPSGN